MDQDILVFHRSTARWCFCTKKILGQMLKALPTRTGTSLTAMDSVPGKESWKTTNQIEICAVVLVCKVQLM
jgi:hypothetical protein